MELDIEKLKAEMEDGDRFAGLKFTHWKFTGTLTESEEKMARRANMFFKPRGIWLSVNGSWENWLDGNWEIWYSDHQDCYEVELDQDINLFIIESKQQFLSEFLILTGESYPKMGLAQPSLLKKFHDELMMKYDGIWLKSEPFYHHRLDQDCDYFYPWDCESICVWREDLIKMKKIKTREVKKNGDERKRVEPNIRDS